MINFCLHAGSDNYGCEAISNIDLGRRPEYMILYEHGGSENHGCEAIVRSTVSMVGEPTRLFSLNQDQDEKYGLAQICELNSDTVNKINKGTKEWLFSGIQTKLSGKYDLTIKYQRKKLINSVKKGDVLLSIGGDNYCYPGATLLASLNDNLRRKGAKIVLWGCSVEPELLENPIIADDLSKFDLITARETISYEALKKINQNTVLVADPAFTLERIDCKLPEGWIDHNMIGFNISPLIMRKSTSPRTAFNAFRDLLSYILKNTNCGIALIPHVVWETNDDRELLKELYEEYKDTGRVLLIPDCNCMELKGYIARCRLFIGARTHATIAAYSNNIPTLAIGYSVKAKGIAKDIFGTHEKYVIPIQDIKDSVDLIELFKWLYHNEKCIKQHLSEVMPEYIRQAYLAKEALDKILMR